MEQTPRQWLDGQYADWAAFVAEAAQFGCSDPFRSSHLFRGQSNAAWPLRPSLSRLLPTGVTEAQASEIERLLLREYKAQAQSFARLVDSRRQGTHRVVGCYATLRRADKIT
jgi:hypothetical protein